MTDYVPSRRELKRLAGQNETREYANHEFVSRHNLRCFKCKQSSFVAAKVGTSKRGPWAICKGCVGQTDRSPWKSGKQMKPQRQRVSHATD